MKNFDLKYGDCLEVMREISSASIDFILIDPPYGITACKWDEVIPFNLMWTEIKRIRKPNAATAIFGSEPFSSALRMSNKEEFKYDYVWIKTKASNFQHARRMPMRRHETISVFGNKIRFFLQLRKLEKPIKSSRKRKGGNLHGAKIIDSGNYEQRETGFVFSDLNFSNPSGAGHLHPTQKPVPLLEHLIKLYTLESETVLDFTMGSGSTGVACKNLNRNFIGIEKEERYFRIAKDRILK